MVKRLERKDLPEQPTKTDSSLSLETCSGQPMILALYDRISTTDQSSQMKLCESRWYADQTRLASFAEYVDMGRVNRSDATPPVDSDASVSRIGSAVLRFC
jgi:hypothetical protein